MSRAAFLLFFIWVKIGAVLKNRICSSKYDYKHAMLSKNSYRTAGIPADDARPPGDRPFSAVECPWGYAENWLDKRPALRYFLLSYFITYPKQTGDRHGTTRQMADHRRTCRLSYLKMSRSKLYQLAQKGELPGSKIGTQWRFDRDEIDDWIKSLRQTTVAKASVNNG